MNSQISKVFLPKSEPYHENILEVVISFFFLSTVVSDSQNAFVAKFNSSSIFSEE
jgi:hypothetical protein